MHLSPAQLATLKAAIAADGTLNTHPNTADGNKEIEKILATASTFVVWDSNTTRKKLALAIMQLGTSFDAITGSKRESLIWATGFDSWDFRDAGVRASFDDWCGAQAALKASISNAGKRFATKGERIFATGTGTNATPGLTTFEGFIPADEIEQARNLT